MKRTVIMRRQHIEVNNDPQRRCYNGCHASTEIVLSEWEVMNYTTEDKAPEQLKFWRELNDYAVSQRGASAQCDYKIDTLPEEIKNETHRT